MIKPEATLGTMPEENDPLSLSAPIEPITPKRVRTYDPELSRSAFQNIQPLQAVQEPSSSDLSFGETLGDIALGLPRGIANAGIDLWNLAADTTDHVGLDFMPQIDRFKSQTFAGDISSSIFQFGAGFVTGGAILKGVGLASQMAKYGAFGRLGYNAAKGAVADTLFFNAESNISTLLNDHDIGGPLTEFLSTDKDDPEIYNRLKTAIEGAGIGGFIDLTMAGFRAFKRTRAAERMTQEAIEKGFKGDSAELTKVFKETLDEQNELKQQVATGLIPKAPTMAEKDEKLLTETIASFGGQDMGEVRKFIADPSKSKISGDFNKKVAPFVDIDKVDFNYDEMPYHTALSEVYLRNELGLISDAEVREAGMKGKFFRPSATGPKDEDVVQSAQPLINLLKKTDKVTRDLIKSGATLDGLRVSGRPNLKHFGPQQKAAIDKLWKVSDLEKVHSVHMLNPFQRAVLAIGKLKTPIANIAEGSEKAVLRAYENIYREAAEYTHALNRSIPPELVAENFKQVTDWLHMDESKASTFFMRLSQQIKDTPGQLPELSQMGIKMMAYKSTMENVSATLGNAFKGIKSLEEATPEQLAELVDSVIHTSNYVKAIQGKGGGKNIVGLGSGLQFTPFIENRTPEQAMNYLKELGGIPKIRQILNFHKENLEKAGAAALLNTEIHRKGRTWDMVAEYYINGLLSHGQTHVVNFLSNAIMTAYRPLETIIGGAMRAVTAPISFNPGRFQGGLVAIKDGLRTYTELTTGFLDTLGLLGGKYGGATTRQAMWDSFKTGRSTLLKGMKDSGKFEELGAAITADNVVNASVLTPAARFLASNSPEMVGKLAATTVNAGGALWRVPTKMLAAADELFKQLNFRARARTLFKQEADDLALTRFHSDPNHANGPVMHPRTQKDIDNFKSAYVAGKMNRVIRDGQAYTDARIKMEADAYINSKQWRQIDGRWIPTDRLGDTKELAQEFLDTRVDQGAYNVAKASIDRAREVTFTEESGKVIGLLKAFTNYFPPAKLILPFISTPVNLVKAAARRTLDPILGVGEYSFHAWNSMVKKLPAVNLPGAEKSATKFVADLTSEDPVRKADAIGRLTMGIGIMAVGTQLAANAMDPEAGIAIVGKGPQEPTLNRLWQNNKENLEYSIRIGKVGDPNTRSYQFNRFDPIGILLGTIADLTQYSYWTKEKDQDTLEALSVATITAISNNVVKKTYLSGLTDTLDILNGPEPHKIGRFFRTLGATFTRPGFMASPAWGGEEENTLREVHTYAEAQLNRTPYGAAQLTPIRNPIGEEIKRDKQAGEDQFGRWMAFWSPIKTKGGGGPDPVLDELTRLKHGFKPTEDDFQISGIRADLTQFKNEKGQTAADRYAELVGTIKAGDRTLRQSLKALFESPQYKSLPEFTGDDALNNPKVKLAGAFFTEFRQAAKAKMYGEYKDLQKYIQDAAIRLQQGMESREVR